MQNFIRAIGGAPMVDPMVNIKALFALVCEKRRRIDGSQHPARQYADPLEAKAVYQRASGGTAVEEYASVEVDSEGLAKIDSAIEEIVQLVPEWKGYFTIPIRWRLLTITGVGSDTAPHIPQSIFLSPQMFETRGALREQIVHEMSHVWMSFTLEMTPWTIDSDTNFVLPSGTGNKKIWQVLLALGFAVSAVKLYRGIHAAAGLTLQQVQRMERLVFYANGCIKTARESGLLAANGQEIVEACSREMQLELA